MNWTGGSLQRTKQANKGILQKQKAHFARTRNLQHTSQSPHATFRPSYLQDCEEQAQEPSSLEPRTTHQAGLRAQHEGDSLSTPRWSGHTRAHYGDHEIASESARLPQTPQNHAQGLLHRENLIRDKPHKRQKHNVDTQIQLLEANRKRLLKQQDWVGAGSSEPVSLHFLTSKEKGRFGKRKKPANAPGAVYRQTQRGGITTHRSTLADDRFEMLKRNAHSTQHEDLRIRFGTDALTTTCSTQQGYSQSHASSSDQMLFDQPSRTAEQNHMQSARNLTSPGPHSSPHAAQECNGHSYQLRVTDEEHRQYNDSPHAEYNSDHSIDQITVTSVPRLRENSNLEVTKARREVLSPCFQITQLGGGKDPLRLIFEDQETCISPFIGPATQPDDHESIGPSIDAGVSQIVMRSQCGDSSARNGYACVIEGPSAVTISDEQLWKSFLAIPDRSSSHTTDSAKSGTGILHPQPIVLGAEAAYTSWSQRGTQCDQSRISLSSNSDSPPFLRREYGSHLPIPPGTVAPSQQGKTRQTASRQIDENERLWREFVFGSQGIQSSVPSSPRSSEVGDKDREQRACVGSSGYLPLSAAVSSTMSTPFMPVSELASRMSDSVQSAVRFMPPIASRASRTPTTSRASVVVEVSGEEECDALAARSPLGQYTVNHASQQHSSTCETNLNILSTLSHTGTSSSGLDSRLGRRQTAHGHALVERESLRHPGTSVVCNIPSSSDEGLDLIDRERLDSDVRFRVGHV